MGLLLDSCGFSRRDFLKGSIVAAVGVAGAGVLSGCGSTSDDEVSASDETIVSTSDGGTVTLHRGYGAAHGESSFTSVVVATAEDGTILGARVDEFQFMDESTEGIVGVPNSDASFAEGIIDGMVLMSKYENSDIYSAMIQEKAGATSTWAASMEAIEAYCVGKLPADLEDVSLDAVSGATLVDTPNYIALVAEVAQDDYHISSGTYTGDGSDLQMGRSYVVAHGESAFCDAASLVQGDTLVATNIDEFQFSDADTYEGVPNSDASFGENYADGVVLMSKAINSDVYFTAMQEKASATTPWLDSIQAIEDYCAGSDIDSVTDEADAVSGATLVDTANYVAAAQTAAQSV